jgi:hypothetical protein
MSRKIEYLYRIIRFEHLVDMFENSVLYFSRPSAWDDPYELRIDHPAMNEVFAQCWCRRGVSDAMWRIYSPNHFGVRIKVRRPKLLDQLALAKPHVPFNSRKIGAVKYRRQSEIDIFHKALVQQLEDKYEPRKALDSLMYKRNAFNHEVETRVLLHAKNVPITQSGIRVPINPHNLIETILADPRMPDPVFKAFTHYVCGELGFVGRFGKSTIYSSKQVHRVGYEDDES